MVREELSAKVTFVRDPKETRQRCYEATRRERLLTKNNSEAPEVGIGLRWTGIPVTGIQFWNGDQRGHALRGS